MNKEKLKRYLANNASVLNIRSIEREADLAEGTVRRFINGERSLSDEALKKLLPVISKLGYK